ncbi:mis18-binding protein 1 isoform X2 [Betta splendens]|uniref:Mis18-binding protein 1 isoform X2 n=1 Tax=Betta splendens TaxID=158456 RepID=A0A6P7LIU8_BETSP|nr:mis18-binding protein 1 isoform X2 [Betta splendens]
MASYYSILQDTNRRLESPAKVFAKLKAKVQRDLMSAKKDVSPDDDALRNVREEYGADCNSPRTRSGGIWMVNTSTENHRFDSHLVEVQPVTLSPMASPQKSFGHSFVVTGNKRVDNMRPAIECGDTFISRLRNGPLLESTAMCVPVSSVNREQNVSQPTEIRDSDGCKITRTPMKIPPALNDRARNVFAIESAVQSLHMSPAKLYSPMKDRLRKRKADQGFNRVSSSTKEVNAEVESQTRRCMRSPVLSDEDTVQSTGPEKVGGVRGCPTDLLSSPRVILEKRCANPMMSPAKVFQYMKERENKRMQQDVHKVTSSKKELFYGDQRRSEMCHSQVSELVIPLKRCRVETADSSSQPSEDDAAPDVQVAPVLLDDPLLLDSPCISIPRKRQAVVKPKKVPLFEKTPNESVIYLKHWFLRKNPMGLFVDGIHREENIQWNSNIIIKRLSESAVETKSGRVYFLVGKMKMDIDSGFPRWFLKEFVNGFPPNWKALYQKFLSESREETKKNSEGRNSIVKAASLSVSLQRNRQGPCKTPSCPPPSAIKVSRSGRTIKPPLEYWKGGRVILDAHMNVTIHECYNTSICVPEVTTTVSASKSHKLPCTEGRTQCKSASEEEASAPLRKVKASRRKRNQANADIEESAPEPFLQKPRESEKSSKRRSNKPELDTNRGSVRERKQRVTSPPESITSKDKIIQDQSSDEELTIKRNIQQKGQNRWRRVQQNHMLLSSESSEVSDVSAKKKQKKTRLTKTSGAAQTQNRCRKRSPPTRPLLKSTQSSRKVKANKGNTIETLHPVEHSFNTRSRQTCPATERMFHLNPVLLNQQESETASTCRSNKPEHDTNRRSLRERKQTVTSSPESLTSNDDTIQEQSSDEELSVKRNIQPKGQNRQRKGRLQQNHMLLSSDSSEVSDASAKKTRLRKTSGAAQTHKSCSKKSPATKPLLKSTQSSKKDKANKGHTAASRGQDEDEWTEAELVKLNEAVSYYPKHMTGYWEKVAAMVGTRSAAECHHQHTYQGTSQTPAKKARKPRKEKAEAPKHPATDQPAISARAGTLKRKQQVRQFLEAMPKEDVDDVFTSAYMQNKRFEMPSMCPSDDYDFAMSDLEPQTPVAKLIPDVKTPQCLHITPGMMGSPNSNNDDKYVYHLQKRMKKNQFNVCKRAQPLKRFTPTPTVKRTMKRCSNTENSFVVWEMFPGNEGPLSESEEDFYFSEND